MPKSTENTVFVRFIPTPSQKVMRHQLEDIFSQAGPIKKSSWINSNSNVNNKKNSSSEAEGNSAAASSSPSKSKGYGFIKYVSQEDAEIATKEFNGKKIDMDGKKYTVKVELASESTTTTATTKAAASSKKDDRAGSNNVDGTTTTTTTIDNRGNDNDLNDDDELAFKKKKCRIIIRNLSFYAKESHVRQAMEENFGSVVDVHLPRVQSNLHVGFCFVTFADTKNATKAVETKKIDIKKRTVSMEWSVPKRLHQQQQQQQKHHLQQAEVNVGEEDEESSTRHSKLAGDETDKTGSKDEPELSSDKSDDDDEDGSDSDDSDSEGSETEASSVENDDEEDDSDDDASKESSPEDEEEEEEEDHAVQQKRTLFLRNLPFDTTRRDLFTIFAKFGYVESIYLVRDSKTDMLKGTAFVTFAKSQSAQRVIREATTAGATAVVNDGTSTMTTEDAIESTVVDPSFVSQRSETTTTVDGKSSNAASTATATTSTGMADSPLFLRGRRILVNFAVDKETAATFDTKENNINFSDRRNMYLQQEARVESSSADPAVRKTSTNTWDDIPEQDQKKRQTALKDKTTKLRSPIFFINPKRLSFRNLAKHVDEGELQKLCQRAITRGLEKGLVGAKDLIAHWRAGGEMSTRTILAKVQELEASGDELLPQLDPSANIKEYIPSVYIDRDFSSTTTTYKKKKKSEAPSRGFGFAEFTHHVHALAVLRELNNNSSYSREFAAGGKAADTLKKKAMTGGGGSKGGNNDYMGEDGRVRVPRLIVDFAVENKIKAKKQAERRLQQQLREREHQDEKRKKKKDNKNKNSNKVPRGDDTEDDDAEEGTKKRKGRGALQRERKRKRIESGEVEAEKEKKLLAKARAEARKEMRKEQKAAKELAKQQKQRDAIAVRKNRRAQRKAKEMDDVEEERLESFVRTYRSSVVTPDESDVQSANNKNNTKNQRKRKAAQEKRWFE